jgi:hypothetical protein
MFGAVVNREINPLKDRRCGFMQPPVQLPQTRWQIPPKKNSGVEFEGRGGSAPGRVLTGAW